MVMRSSDEVRRKALGEGAGLNREDGVNETREERVTRYAKSYPCFTREEISAKLNEIDRKSKPERLEKTPSFGPTRQSSSRTPAERVAFELGRLEANGMDLSKAYERVSVLLPNATEEYDRVRSSGNPRDLDRMNAAFRSGESAALGLGDELVEVEKGLALAKAAGTDEESLRKAAAPAGKFSWELIRGGILSVRREGANGPVRISLPHESWPLLSAWRNGVLPSGYSVVLGNEPISPDVIDWSDFSETMVRRGFAVSAAEVNRK